MTCENCIHYKLCRDNDLSYDDNVVIREEAEKALEGRNEYR